VVVDDTNSWRIPSNVDGFGCVSITIVRIA